MNTKFYFLIALGSILLVSIALGATTLHTAKLLRSENDRVIYAQKQLTLLKRVESDMVWMLKEAAEYMLLKEEEEYNEFLKYKKDIQMALTLLKETTENEISFLAGAPEEDVEEEERVVVETIRVSISELADDLSLLMERIKAGDSALSIEVFEETIESVYDDQLALLIEDQIADEEEEIEDVYTSLQSLFDDFSKFSMNMMALLMGVVCVALAVAFRSFYKPISGLVETVKAIGQGNLNPAIPGGSGEIGTLGTSLKELAQQLADTQAQLVHSAKMASIGQLAAGVAHEMNQPLMVISMNSQMLARQLAALGASNEMRESVDLMSRNAKRLSYVINHLRQFSRQKEVSKHPLVLNDVVRSSFTLLTQQFEAREIELVTEFQEPLPMVVGSINELEQVFVNILTNARDAISADSLQTGGTVSVTTRLNDAGSMISIFFSDTGAGISDDVVNKIYDPFFTTKGLNEGTGLGLSIAYGIVKEHGGDIVVLQTSERGTTFEVRLPVDLGGGEGDE